MKKILSKWLVLSSVLVLTFLSCKKNLDKREVNNNWTNLFNGKNLNGWTQLEGDSKYTVKNGQIIGTTIPNTPNSVLATDKEYDNFILELDVKVDTALNSGIQIRSHSNKDYKDGKVYGYQVEVDPSKRAWSGGIYDSRRRGWLVDLKDKPQARKAFKNGAWNHYKIRANKDTINTWVNNIHIATLIDSVDSSGFIGLQVHHSTIDKPLKVHYRDIKIENID